MENLHIATIQVVGTSPLPHSKTLDGDEGDDVSKNTFALYLVLTCQKISQPCSRRMLVTGDREKAKGDAADFSRGSEDDGRHERAGGKGLQT